LTAALLDRWGNTIRTLEIVPGTGGIFDVHVDGDLVFTKKMIGRYPEPDDVVPLVRAYLDGR
jgi:selenoprotein W-related protein